MNFFGAGLLATAGKAGEGAFKGMEKGITISAKEKIDKKKQEALALREKNLAEMRHRFKTKENVQQSSLATGRQIQEQGWRDEEAKTERTWKSGEAAEERKVKREGHISSRRDKESDRYLEVIELTGKMIEDNLDIDGANYILRKEGITDVEYNKQGRLVEIKKGTQDSSPDVDADTGDILLEDLLNEIKQGNQSNIGTPQSSGLLQASPVSERVNATRVNSKLW